MFDITSSKLLLLAIVALLVIGPKDFPALLRTIGKYMGIIRGHAKDFRMQFDQAMRESELSELKKDVENIAKETEASMSATGKSVEKSFDEARQSVEGSLAPPPTLDPQAHNADALPIAPPQPAQAQVAANGADGASPVHQPPVPSQAPPVLVPATEKTGA